MSNSPLQTNKSASKKSAINPMIIVAGILMICAIGYLGYSNASKDRVINQTVQQLEETEALRMELEEQFNQSISELEDMRTSNEELNALIEAQKEELEDQRAKVAGLIGNKKKLKAARQELKNMKAQTEEYVARIEQLQAENEMLAATNLQLGEEKTALTTELEAKVAENEDLNESKAILTSEKTDLTSKNKALAATVNLASVVKVNNIKVDGFKRKDSGKTKRRRAAKSVDEVKVCFDMTENQVTKAGVETFHVRILSPLGETLFIETMGSGTTMSKDSNEEIRFTKSLEEEYVNAAENVCMRWKPENGFQSGTYQVEIFNKGHLSGKGSFELK